MSQEKQIIFFHILEAEGIPSVSKDGFINSRCVVVLSQDSTANTTAASKQTSPKWDAQLRLEAKVEDDVVEFVIQDVEVGARNVKSCRDVCRTKACKISELINKGSTWIDFENQSKAKLLVKVSCAKTAMEDDLQTETKKILPMKIGEHGSRIFYSSYFSMEESISAETLQFLASHIAKWINQLKSMIKVTSISSETMLIDGKWNLCVIVYYERWYQPFKGNVFIMPDPKQISLKIRRAILEESSREGKRPNPRCQIRLSEDENAAEKTFSTLPVSDTLSPSWDRAFKLQVKDFNTQLQFVVQDSDGNDHKFICKTKKAAIGDLFGKGEVVLELQNEFSEVVGELSLSLEAAGVSTPTATVTGIYGEYASRCFIAQTSSAPMQEAIAWANNNRSKIRAIGLTSPTNLSDGIGCTLFYEITSF